MNDFELKVLSYLVWGLFWYMMGRYGHMKITKVEK